MSVLNWIRVIDAMRKKEMKQARNYIMKNDMMVVIEFHPLR